MFRMIVNKYGPKLVKTKKQASYMTKEKVVEEELPLEEAIKRKCDPKMMD